MHDSASSFWIDRMLFYWDSNDPETGVWPFAPKSLAVPLVDETIGTIRPVSQVVYPCKSLSADKRLFIMVAFQWSKMLNETRNFCIRACPIGSSSNILGSPEARRVSFRYGSSLSFGQYSFVQFELCGRSAAQQKVQKASVTWQWEYANYSNDDQDCCATDKKWKPLQTTSHIVYATLDYPKRPWTTHRAGTTNMRQGLSLPWRSVIDVAARYAEGASTFHEAAAMITNRLFSDPTAGLVQHFSYGSAPIFEREVDNTLCFDLTKFLRYLKIGWESKINCDDCAHAVVTLANFLGCNLKPLSFLPSGQASHIQTTPILEIGNSDKVEHRRYKHHVVAIALGRKIECPDNTAEPVRLAYVYDACIAIKQEGKSSVPTGWLLIPLECQWAGDNSTLPPQYLLLVAKDPANWIAEWKSTNPRPIC